MKPLLIALAFASTTAGAADWAAQPSSTLGFTGEYQGESFEGKFKTFDAKIAVDPADPTKTAIDVSIDLASVDTENAERDETLATSDFFWTEKFPRATFTASGCKAGTAAGTVDCQGKLTIRDKSQAVPFVFAWAESGGKATLNATVKLDRTAFDVGTGDWADAETIAHDVTVKVALQLAPK